MWWAIRTMFTNITQTGGRSFQSNKEEEEEVLSSTCMP
jgi:hypothetical protein